MMKIGCFSKDDADLNPETEEGNLISFGAKFLALFAYTTFEGVHLFFESRIVQDRLVSKLFYFYMPNKTILNMNKSTLYFLALFLTSIFSYAQKKSVANEKPNIIVIYTDDHGYADLGIQGWF
jgi:hypothetical protein